MDEHRIGLHPTLRPVWAPVGEPLTAPINTTYEWAYLYAFVCPESGESHYWIIPNVSIPTYQEVLKAFARNVGAGKDHHILLVEDNAGFHGGEPPDGIEIVRLPPYSPELQPVERLWQLTDQTVANKCFDSLEKLLETIGEQCKLLETQFDRITKQTLFHWWPLSMT